MLSFVIIYQSQRSITFPHTGGVNRKQFEDGAPPEMVETLSASQRNFTLRCSGIVQH